MNKENLLRMADHIETIPEEMFNMTKWRKNEDRLNHKCGSTGCIIGHCTILDSEENIPRVHGGFINFISWSEKFTELDFHGDNWDYLFDDRWVDDSPKKAAARIRYFVENGLPENWSQQIAGNAELPYLKKTYYNP